MVLAQHGLWKAQWFSYTGVSMYHGNRFALTFFTDLGLLAGSQAYAIYPSLVLLTFCGAVYIILYQLCSGRHISKLSCLAAGLVFVFFVFLQAPNRSQSLYWLNGMLTYTAPTAAALLQLGMVLWTAKRPALSGWVLIPLFLGAVVSGGFSETGAAFQLGVFGLVLLLGMIGRRSKIDALSQMVRPTIAVLIGFVVATMILYISPITAIRQAGLPQNQNPIALVQMIARHTLDFIWGSIRGYWFSNLVLIISFSAFGYLSLHTRTARSWFAHAGFVMVAAFLLIGSVMAPSAYAYSAYPEERSQFLARITFLAALASIAWVVGASIRQKTARPAWLAQFLLSASLIGLIFSGMYVLRSGIISLQDLSFHQRYAALWDERDSYLRIISAAGVQEANVIELDHPISGVGELSPDPNAWHNNCAEGYYGIPLIRANQPGWD